MFVKRFGGNFYNFWRNFQTFHFRGPAEYLTPSICGTSLKFYNFLRV